MNTGDTYDVYMSDFMDWESQLAHIGKDARTEKKQSTDARATR